jgi:uncharacterized protein YqgV (UPF0045/DUF77 family)
MIAQTDLDQFRREVERMRRLAGFARGGPVGSNVSLRWAAHAPRAYVQARQQVTDAIAATQREVAAVNAQLATLSTTPTPLLGSAAAAALTRRVRTLEAQHTELATNIEAAQSRLASALSPADEAAATEGARRVCAAMLTSLARQTASEVATSLATVRPHARHVVRMIENYETAVRQTAAALGSEMPVFDLVSVREAWKTLSEAEEPQLKKRPAAERQAA